MLLCLQLTPFQGSCQSSILVIAWMAAVRITSESSPKTFDLLFCQSMPRYSTVMHALCLDPEKPRHG